MKKDILMSFSRTFNKAKIVVKKYSPEILVGVGIAGTVASAVIACKETTKAGDILDEMNDELDKIHEVSSMNREDYTEQDCKKDTAIVYLQTGIKFVKLYAPSVILGTLSITSILAGHNILRKRHVALAAAYAGIDKSFKEYRNRVIEKFGKELESELRYNLKTQEIETVTMDNDGNETTITETVSVADPNGYSDYARFFDDGCLGWTKDPEDNLRFLKIQQTYANEKLKKQGYLFLNDVYGMLGIPVTKAGQCVGWVYDEKNPVGDNFVDFGLYDISKPVVRNFVNGYERTILLDFNVDGNILDLI